MNKWFGATLNLYAKASACTQYTMTMTADSGPTFTKSSHPPAFPCNCGSSPSALTTRLAPFSATLGALSTGSLPFAALPAAVR